jgi:hypothetical protein
MTNPTDDPAARRLRIELDEGEVLEIDGSTIYDRGAQRGVPVVVLRLPSFRAHALSHVLSIWTQLVDLVEEVRHISGTEDSLARGLHEAAAVLDDPAALADSLYRHSTVRSGERLAAMGELQHARSDLTHSELIAVVDAAAWWVDQDDHEEVWALFSAVVGHRQAQAAYDALTRLPRPKVSRSEQSEGLTS